MISTSHLFLALMLASNVMLAAQPSYKGGIRLPVDLYTAEGGHLEKGQYTMEVKIDEGNYDLAFLQNDKMRLSVKGEALNDRTDDPTGTPLVGAQYVRSSEDPIGTEAERHFSKTGLPQYEEEGRPWKAAMRIYTAPDEKEAIFLFKEKQDDKWNRIVFKLLLEPHNSR